MRRLASVLSALLLSLYSCAGVLRDVRVGEQYAIINPVAVMVSVEPRTGSEGFYLDEPESFVVHDTACAGELGAKDCFAELMVAGRVKSAARAAFYAVTFESGRKGYINAMYFYPRLSYSIASKERSREIGLDPAGLAKKLRDERNINKAESERFEGDRRRLIQDSAWSGEVKGLLLDGKVFLGMDTDQAMLSLARAGSHPKIMRKDTEKGIVEKWVLEDSVYYFRRGILVRWKTPAGEAGEKADN